MFNRYFCEVTSTGGMKCIINIEQVRAVLFISETQVNIIYGDGENDFISVSPEEWQNFRSHF